MARIHLYYGNGEGKTLAAIGQAIRSIGHGKRVVMVQFLKGRKSVGEVKASSKIDGFEIYQFGSTRFIDLEKPSENDIKRAREGISFAKEIIKQKPFVLILDEITLAAYYGIVDVEEVLNLISSAPKRMLIILTGRKSPKRLIDVADLVTEMKEIKHPFKKGVKARKGIEY